MCLCDLKSVITINLAGTSSNQLPYYLYYAKLYQYIPVLNVTGHNITPMQYLYGWATRIDRAMRYWYWTWLWWYTILYQSKFAFTVTFSWEILFRPNISLCWINWTKRKVEQILISQALLHPVKEIIIALILPQAPPFPLPPPLDVKPRRKLRIVTLSADKSFDAAIGDERHVIGMILRCRELAPSQIGGGELLAGRILERYF